MIKIDWQSGVPAYDQIVQGMIRLKAIGAFAAGDKLPSVRNLAVDLGVNPNTVQKAYLLLESKGVIYSVSGKGSFFSDGAEATEAMHSAALGKIKDAVTEAIRLGIDIDTVLKNVKTTYEAGGNYND